MNSEEVFCRVGKIWKMYLVVDYWIGEIKKNDGIRSRSNIVWFPDGGRWESRLLLIM